MCLWGKGEYERGKGGGGRVKEIGFFFFLKKKQSKYKGRRTL